MPINNFSSSESLKVLSRKPAFARKRIVNTYYKVSTHIFSCSYYARNERVNYVCKSRGEGSALESHTNMIVCM